MGLFINLVIQILSTMSISDRIWVAAINVDDLSCSFENDNTCSSWSIKVSTWTVEKYAHVDSIFTGPKAAKDGRFYIHTSKKYNSTDYDYAELESATITNNIGSTCFRFWYYMYGSHVQTLSVFLDSTNKFSVSGNKGQHWLCGAIDISDFNGKITFRAGRTLEPFSVIALDYFQVLAAISCDNASCSTLSTVQITSKPTVSPTTSSTTNPTAVSDQNSEDPGGGVKDQLPIAVGVPAGILIVGIIIVGVCIVKKRRSKDDEDNMNRHSMNSNQYISNGAMSPAYTHQPDEEVYTELDEDRMVDAEFQKGGQENGGYIDSTADYAYAEPVEFDRRSNGHVVGNPPDERSTDDYLTPISESVYRKHKVNSMNSLGESDSRSHLNDYLEPQDFTGNDP